MARAADPIGRAFVVGCPRSGTTLLQSMLFAHPDVLSCPETFFFIRTVNPGGRRHRLGLAASGATEAMQAVTDFGVAGQPPRAVLGLHSERACARWFVDALDGAAQRAGKRLWLEKTPSHLSRVDAIERLVPGARIVHIVRAGGPTVASLYEVTHEHPEQWGGDRDLDACADRWSHDVADSAACAGRRAHAFVSYERLVADPAGVLGALCTFLGLRKVAEIVTRMVRDYARAAARVSVDEPWKRGNRGPLVNRNEQDRLALLLDPERRAQLDARLAPAEAQRAGLPFV